MKNKKKNKNKSSRKGINYSAMRCPYCGGSVVFRSADGIYRDNSNGTMLYVCSHYPECDAYVRVRDGTRIPVGTMADRKLRMLRKTAHDYFDQLYQSGLMEKQEAYQWLSHLIDAPLSEAHIGYLGEYYCRLVIDECRKLLKGRRSNKLEIYIPEDDVI